VNRGLTVQHTLGNEAALGPIHTLRHVSVPSPFRIRSVRMVCVHTVRRVQSPSRTAHDRKPAIISIKYAAHCHRMHFPLFVNYTGQQNLTFFFFGTQRKISNPNRTFNSEFKCVSSFSPSPTVCL